MKHKNLPAGALNFAIVLSLIVASTALALQLWQHYRTTLFVNDHVAFQEQQSLESATYYALGHSFFGTEPTTVDLFNNPTDSASIFSKPWGAFVLITATSTRTGRPKSKTSLAGYSTAGAPVLYLCDYNKPISISGNTKITGNAFLPKKGLKRAFVENKKYLGNKLLYGEQLLAESALPGLYAEFLTSIAESLQGNMSPSDSTTDVLPQSHSQKWNNSSLYIIGENFFIDSNFLSGHITVFADQSITISASAHLEHIRLIAPRITIQEGFSGSLHTIATEQIELENNVTLSYPSSLVVYNPSESTPKMSIGENCNIGGSLCLISKPKHRGTAVNFSLGSAANIYGQAYIQGISEIKGSITGSLLTNRLVLHTKAGIYENLLLDNTLHHDTIKGGLSGLPISFPSSPTTKSIAQWFQEE